MVITETELAIIDAAAYAFAARTTDMDTTTACAPLMVYVAGPLTKGDPQANMLRAYEVAGAIMKGADKYAQAIACFVPHGYLMADAAHPRDYERWMESCMVALERCDVLVRLPGESPGSDREVERALSLGLHVIILDEHCNPTVIGALLG